MTGREDMWRDVDLAQDAIRILDRGPMLYARDGDGRIETAIDYAERAVQGLAHADRDRIWNGWQAIKRLIDRAAAKKKQLQG